MRGVGGGGVVNGGGQLGGEQEGCREGEKQRSSVNVGGGWVV